MPAIQCAAKEWVLHISFAVCFDVHLCSSGVKGVSGIRQERWVPPGRTCPCNKQLHSENMRNTCLHNAQMQCEKVHSGIKSALDSVVGLFCCVVLRRLPGRHTEVLLTMAATRRWVEGFQPLRCRFYKRQSCVPNSPQTMEWCSSRAGAWIRSNRVFGGREARERETQRQQTRNDVGRRNTAQLCRVGTELRLSIDVTFITENFLT